MPSQPQPEMAQGPQPITVAAALAGGFDELIDVRSPAEFAEDHLPGALNWPVLDDDERARVGTLYVQTSPLAARKLGAALVTRRIAALLEAHVQDKPREWRPLVYCWRGGQRSGSLALVLSQIGFRTGQLQGGYKAFRAHVRTALDTLPERYDYRVLCGRTGSGKTRLLGALRDAGAQVLDLEGLARHRGSVLGVVPGCAQPSQKAFETAIHEAYGRLDPRRRVWVESESRKIGALQVPDALLARMREARCVLLELPTAARIALLKEEYAHFLDDPGALAARLAHLKALHGQATIGRWSALAHAGDFDALVHDLLASHYDPTYLRAMQRNYAGFADAARVSPSDIGMPAFRALAKELVAGDRG